MKKIVLLLTTVLLPLLAVNLREEIKKLETRLPQSYDDKVNLSVLYIYSSQYRKSSQLLSSLFRYKKDPEFAFNNYLVCAAAGLPGAAGHWQEYLKIPQENRMGERWDRMGRLVMEMLSSGRVVKEEEFLHTLRNLYLGKGYYTILVLIDFYRRCGGEKYQLSLLELEAEVYYRVRYFKESESLYRELINKTGGQYFYLMLARIAYRKKQFIEVEKHLKNINDQTLMGFNYFYILAKSASAAGNKKKCLSYKEKLSRSAKSEGQKRLLYEIYQ